MKNFFHFVLILTNLLFAQNGDWKDFPAKYEYIPYPSEITVIEIDKFNNKWIGTSGIDNQNEIIGGLVKFDGNTWTQYTKTNSDLPDGYITSVEFDKENNVWVGMKDSGVVIIKNDSIRKVNAPFKFIKKGMVKDILCDRIGNIWILFSDVFYFDNTYVPSALMTYNGKEWANFNLDSLSVPNLKINCMEVDDKNNIFFGSQDAILKYDGAKWETIDAPGNDNRLSILALLFDLNGILWVSTSGFGGNIVPTIMQYYEGNWLNLNEEYSAGYEPEEIILDNNNHLWVSGELAKYNRTSWQYFNRNNSPILWDDIQTLAIDSSGIVWCGTPKGVCTFDGENWSYYSSSDKIQENTVNNIVVDYDDTKWIAFPNFGLLKYNEQNWEIYNKSNSLIPANTINDVLIDSKKNIWVATDNGLGLFDGVTWRVFNEDNTGFTINNIHDLEIDSKGNLWLTTGTLFSFDGNTWKKFDFPNSELSQTDIFTLGVDSKDKIWMGTEDGFYIYDDDSLTHFTHDNSELPDNWVQCFAFDSIDNAWIGTSNGLVRINNNNWEVFSSDIGGWDINTITIDENDQVWVGFFWQQGISKYDGYSWEHYNTTFQSNMTGINALSIDIDKKGNLWIGTLHQGVIQFNEDKIISVNDKYIPNTNQENNISIYPNPFNMQTIIQFSLKEPSIIISKIYSITGELILTKKHGFFSKGENSFQFSGQNLSSGIYLFSLEISPTANYRKSMLTKKILLIK